MLGSWRRRFTSETARLRKDGRAALLWSMRITAAATASYVVALLFFPGTKPLLAPLTAMLVVQVTPVSLLRAGLDRVLAVVAGVSVAVWFAARFPLEWWTLGLLIFVAITIGQAMRLKSNLVEVAISAMLVLGVGTLSAEAAAWQRIAETLVGAAVAIAINLLLPPKVASADASAAIDDLANALSELLNRAAAELWRLAGKADDVAAATRGWLEDARQISQDIPQVSAAVLHAEQGRRLNVRAVATPDVTPGLRQGLESLEHSAVAVRTMFRSLVDGTHEARWLDDEVAEDVLRGIAETFTEMAAAVDAFGQMVREEGDTVELDTVNLQALREAIAGLHEARERLEDVLLGHSDPTLVELHAAVLSTVKRLMRELDLDERVRRQVQLVRAPRRRRTTRRSGRLADIEPTPDAETQQLLDPFDPQDPPPR